MKAWLHVMVTSHKDDVNHVKDLTKNDILLKFVVMWQCLPEMDVEKCNFSFLFLE